jgi:hypothetical protein
MAQTSSIAVSKFVDLLTSVESGLGLAVGTLSEASGQALATIPAESVIQQNAPVALMERSLAVKYPTVHVYTERVHNLLTEKFRTFSGKIRTVAEVRVSQDRIEGLEDQVRLYVDSVTQVLDASRGSWGQGMYFTGVYEVKYEPVQRGGLNFLQIAKVIFEVDLSV